MDAHVIVTVDLGFGDAGKGSVVDYLSRPGTDVRAVVRYNGGPQAAHRVVQPDGREHVFSQFGAGAFHEGVETLLGPRVLVNPENLGLEHAHLYELGVKDALDRLSIDSRCVLVTPFHVAANRIRELLRGDGRHGSCGQGIGEARADELAGVAARAGDVSFSERTLLFRKLVRIQARKREQMFWLLDGVDDPPERALEELRVLEDFELCAQLAADYEALLGRLVVPPPWTLERLLDEGRVVFEGAQGVLLDERHGFHPYTTWTDTTTRPALDMLAEAGYVDSVVRLGIVRAYQTRHGPGPFPTEDAALAAALPDVENGTGEWQGAFRVGWLDLQLLRYATAATGGVDGLAVTCLDRVLDDWHAAVLYRNMNTAPFVALSSCDPIEHGRRLTTLLERAQPLLWPLPPTLEGYEAALAVATRAPLVLASYGPTLDEKAVVTARAPAGAL